MTDAVIGSAWLGSGTPGVVAVAPPPGNTTSPSEPPPAPTSGGGYPAAATHVIHALAPDVSTGLAPLPTDGSDIVPALTAQLGYIKSTWGSGELALPTGDFTCLSTISIPAGVTVHGSALDRTILNFQKAPSSTVGVRTNGDRTNPINNVWIKGMIGYDSSMPTNTTGAGLSINGRDVKITNVSIEAFNTGLALNNNNTFIFKGDGLDIRYCNLCVDLDQSADHNGGTALVENGERMVITNSLLCNSKNLVRIVGSGATLFFSGCSFDYSESYGFIQDGFLFMENCHLETGYKTPGKTGWSSPQSFLFDARYAARMQFSNCRFEINGGSKGVYTVVNPYSAPGNPGSGYARFQNCTWWGNMPKGTAQYTSEQLVPFPAGVETVTVESPFATRWNAPTAQLASRDGAAPGPYSFWVSDMRTGSGDWSVPPAQTVTVSRRVPDGLPVVDSQVLVDF